MKKSVKDIDWIFSLKDEVLSFLEYQKSATVPGYYKYSYNGDLYTEKRRWNVGSSVFALKILYILGIKKNKEIIDIGEYIKSFIHEDGLIYDNLVYKKSFLRNLFSSIKHRNFGNLLNWQYKMAEARQAYSSLMLYNLLPEKVYVDIPKSSEKVAAYLAKLNWEKPWNASAQFSGLMFFYKLNKLSDNLTNLEYETLTNYAIAWINKLQNQNNGGWYKGHPNKREVINGAMKIITGLTTIDKVQFAYPQQLIDMCLASQNDEHACDNFNVIFVLNYASKLLGRNYRQDEIEEFALGKLSQYRKYYHSHKGGFSFFKNKTNTMYYGVKISKGLDEPDIHGTVLFLWGITIIAQIIGKDADLGFKEFTT